MSARHRMKAGWRQGILSVGPGIVHSPSSCGYARQNSDTFLLLLAVANSVTSRIHQSRPKGVIPQIQLARSLARSLRPTRRHLGHFASRAERRRIHRVYLAVKPPLLAYPHGTSSSLAAATHLILTIAPVVLLSRLAISFSAAGAAFI